MGQKLKDLPVQQGDFVRRDKCSTTITDTHIILVAELPNGKKLERKIEISDFINAIKILSKDYERRKKV